MDNTLVFDMARRNCLAWGRIGPLQPSIFDNDNVKPFESRWLEDKPVLKLGRPGATLLDSIEHGTENLGSIGATEALIESAIRVRH